MSDYGFDIDEHIKRRQNSDNFIPKIGSSINNDNDNSSKYPPIRKRNSLKKPKKVNSRESSEPWSLQKRDKESINRRNASFKPSLIQKGRSFSALLNEGWTKEMLMKHFVLSEKEFDKVIENLEKIYSQIGRKT